MTKQISITRKAFLATICAAALTGLFPATAHADGELLPVIGMLAGAGGGAVVGNQFGHGAGRDAAGAVGMVVGGAVGYGAGYALQQQGPMLSAAPTGRAGPRTYQPYSGAGGYVPNYVAPE